MYAIVEIGGHQYRVAEGDVLYVDRQSEESGNNITFDRVLLTNDGNGGLDFGGPAIDGASVEATVLDHVKADKVIVFKKKRRKGYRKKNGHRQPMSQIKIEAISLSSGKKKKAEKKKEDKPAKKSEKQQVSTDMTAKEAISHIKDTPIDQLKGFVPESEDRVTVQRAWESKQEE
jgi:large subunit ribosomal protein L21